MVQLNIASRVHSIVRRSGILFNKFITFTALQSVCQYISRKAIQFVVRIWELYGQYRPIAAQTRVLKPLRYIWAFPATALGLFFALLALLSGGKVHRIDGVFEVYGGVVTRLLRIGTLWMKTIEALTLGHVVLGQNRVCLEQSRTHERVHLKQYEVWGPFFIPVYLICSLIAVLRGRDPYLDNPFEKEAYKLAASGSKSSKC